MSCNFCLAPSKTSKQKPCDVVYPVLAGARSTKIQLCPYRLGSAAFLAFPEGKKWATFLLIQDLTFSELLNDFDLYRKSASLLVDNDFLLTGL